MKVAATELRIGNWINTICGEKQVLDITENHCRVEYDGGFAPAPHDRITPIPITEEWLLKFGFVKDSFGHLSFGHFFFNNGIKYSSGEFNNL